MRHFQSNDPFYGSGAPWNWWVGLSFPYPRPQTPICVESVLRKDFTQDFPANFPSYFFLFSSNKFFEIFNVFTLMIIFLRWSSCNAPSVVRSLYSFYPLNFTEVKGVENFTVLASPPKHNFFICLHCSPKHCSTWTILLPCLIAFIWNEIEWFEISN